MQFLMYFIYLTALLLCLYLLLINLYLYWFSKLKTFKPVNVAPSTTFSIIIPARDEEENIEACLRTILQNNYPAHLYEIIVADDFSADATPEIVLQLQKEFSNIQVISLKNMIAENINSYKKEPLN